MVNERYEAFKALFGKQPMYIYAEFISEMKELYMGCIFSPILNQDEFTAFIKLNAQRFKI